ncbi:ribose 5-phosphate isomerase A [Lachnospiraceae bacterium 54-53]
MKEEDLRKLCAEKAMDYIKDNTVIGLGAGRNIACLIELLRKAIAENGLNIKVVTPSDNTRNICIQYGIEVLPICCVEDVDVAFDGCGEVDENFYASKGGGGVFTKEKLIGSMAEEYILLIDEQKLKKELSPEQPFSLEILKDSLGYVSKTIKKIGGSPMARTSNNKNGYLITDDGNLILDVIFYNIGNWKETNDNLKRISGVIETSVFTEEVTRLIIAGENGIRVISRN